MANVLLSHDELTQASEAMRTTLPRSPRAKVEPMTDQDESISMRFNCVEAGLGVIFVVGICSGVGTEKA